MVHWSVFTTVCSDGVPPASLYAGDGVSTDHLGVDAMEDELDAIMADGEYLQCFMPQMCIQMLL